MIEGVAAFSVHITSRIFKLSLSTSNMDTNNAERRFIGIGMTGIGSGKILRI
jgi:hypothetical protein